MTSQNKTLVTINDNAVQDGQTIDAADVTVAFDDVQTELQHGWSRVSANDTNVKHLEDAVVGGTGITATTVDDGADETLSIAVDDTVVATTSNSITLASKTLTTPTIADFTNATHDHQDAAGGGQLLADAIDSDVATSGYVLTADGTGGASWAAVGGGGAQPIDLTVTAGETLAERNMVYLDETTGTWFKLDTDATGAIKCGALRGCVNEAGGIASASTGSVRILGEVSGFTGLTAWSRVYGGTTAGGYTQTRPAVTDGGGQVAIAELGVATSTTAIFIQPKPVIYVKRETLTDTSTMTLEHHSDVKSRQRDVRAYVGTTVSASTLTEYTSGNQDDEFTIQGFEGAGATLDVNATGGVSAIGDVTDLERSTAQQFTPSSSGQLTQFKITLSSNNGSPTGNIYWQIQQDDGSDLPDGTILANDNWSPTPSAENTINVTDGPFLDGSTKYWIILNAIDQATNQRYQWQRATSDVYASHVRLTGTKGDAFSLWTPSTDDAEFEVTTSAVTTSDKLAQSFQISTASVVSTVDVYLKKYGSPTGNMTLEIQTDNAGEPSGTAVTNGTSATVAASTLTTSFAATAFTFSGEPSLTGSTTYWLVLTTTDTQSNTNYVIWGADTSTPSYADGAMYGEDASTWSALTADAIFAVKAPATQYDEPCVIGRWSGGTRDIAVRFDDGGGGNPNTQTTIKNVSSGTLDIVTEIEVV